ncbi:MAG: helix-turn-helix domain-containing protein [Phycisphaerae bacterium]|nr:helix-turn-helix domain-containing protein [Phycisphaerae bacterium]
MQSHEVLLTARELGERLAVSPSTVIQWAKDGRIPEVRPSPRIRRFDWGDVVAALKRHQVKQGGATHAD